MAKGTTKKASSGSARKASTGRAAAANARDRDANKPVPLPSGGSFEREDLEKGLERAADRQGANRDAEVNRALANASTDRGTTTAAPNALPDHKVHRAEVMLGQAVENGDGKLVAGETVTEFRQVYDPKSASGDTAAERDEVIVKPSQVGEAGTSSVLSLDEVTPSRAPRGQDTITSVPAETGESGEPGTTSNPEAVEASIADGLAESQDATL